MLGLFLLYFVGKAFYTLAENHSKSKWGFGILGVLSYYFGLVLGGFVLFFIFEFGFSQSLEETNDILVSVLALPFGVLTCWGFYQLLKSRWSKQPEIIVADSDDVLDANLVVQQPEPLQRGS
jgi:membrane-bound ClpP family serine protease